MKLIITFKQMSFDATVDGVVPFEYESVDKLQEAITSCAEAYMTAETRFYENIQHLNDRYDADIITSSELESGLAAMSSVYNEFNDFSITNDGYVFYIRNICWGSTINSFSVYTVDEWFDSVRTK